jgi:hypothetical protein
MQEARSKIGDYVTAELVECQPEPERVAVPVPAVPETSQAQQKAQATIEQTGADPPPAGGRESIIDPAAITNPTHEIVVLKRQVLALRRDAQRLQEWLDTVNSPVYKRVWWWLCGYRFYTLGRWRD